MLAICFRLPLSVAQLHRSVQYDSGESQPQRGGITGTEVALQQVPLVILFASLRGYGHGPLDKYLFRGPWYGRLDVS